MDAHDGGCPAHNWQFWPRWYWGQSVKGHFSECSETWCSLRKAVGWYMQLSADDIQTVLCIWWRTFFFRGMTSSSGKEETMCPVCHSSFFFKYILQCRSAVSWHLWRCQHRCESPSSPEKRVVVYTVLCHKHGSQNGKHTGRFWVLLWLGLGALHCQNNYKSHWHLMQKCEWLSRSMRCDRDIHDADACQMPVAVMVATGSQQSLCVVLMLQLPMVR